MIVEAMKTMNHVPSTLNGTVSKVFVKDGDKVKKINFGDKSMTIKKNNPARKKSYCARSGGIKGKNNKLSANYWSRRMWNC